MGSAGQESVRNFLVETDVGEGKAVLGNAVFRGLGLLRKVGSEKGAIQDAGGGAFRG